MLCEVYDKNTVALGKIKNTIFDILDAPPVFLLQSLASFDVRYQVSKSHVQWSVQYPRYSGWDVSCDILNET